MAKPVEVITIADSDDDSGPGASGSVGGAPKARAADGSGARRKRKADKKGKGKQLEPVDLTIDSAISKADSDIEELSFGPAVVAARSAVAADAPPRPLGSPVLLKTEGSPYNEVAAFPPQDSPAAHVRSVSTSASHPDIHPSQPRAATPPVVITSALPAPAAATDVPRRPSVVESRDVKPAALELAAGDGDAIVEAGENVLGERDIEMGEVGPGESAPLVPEIGPSSHPAGAPTPNTPPPSQLDDTAITPTQRSAPTTPLASTSRLPPPSDSTEGHNASLTEELDEKPSNLNGAGESSVAAVAGSDAWDVDMRLEDSDAPMDTEDAKPDVLASPVADPASPVAPIPPLEDHHVQARPPSRSTSPIKLKVERAPRYRAVIESFLAQRESILAKQLADGLCTSNLKTRDERLEMYDSYVDFCTDLRVTSFPISASMVALFLHDNDLATPSIVFMFETLRLAALEVWEAPHVKTLVTVADEWNTLEENEVIVALVADNDGRRWVQRGNAEASGDVSSARALRSRKSANANSAGKQAFKGYIPIVEGDASAFSDLSSLAGSSIEVSIHKATNSTPMTNSRSSANTSGRASRTATARLIRCASRKTRKSSLVSRTSIAAGRRSSQLRKLVLSYASDDAFTRAVRDHYSPYTLKKIASVFCAYRQFCAEVGMHPFPLVGDVFAIFLHDYAYREYQTNTILPWVEYGRRAIVSIWVGTEGVAPLAAALSHDPAFKLVRRSEACPVALARGLSRQLGRTLSTEDEPATGSTSVHACVHPASLKRDVGFVVVPEPPAEPPLEPTIIDGRSIPNMPLAGSYFSTSSSFENAVWSASRDFMGISTGCVSQSHQRHQIRCNQYYRQSLYPKQRPCPFTLVATSGVDGRWTVGGKESSWEHNHDRHAKILADPSWRPIHRKKRQAALSGARTATAKGKAAALVPKPELRKRSAPDLRAEADDANDDRVKRRLKRARLVEQVAKPPSGTAPAAPRASSSTSTLDPSHGRCAYATPKSPKSTPVPQVDGKPSIAPSLALDTPLSPSDLSRLLVDLSPLLSSPSIAAVLHRAGIDTLARFSNLVFALDEWLEAALPSTSDEFKSVPRLTFKKRLAEKRRELSRA